MSTTSITLQVHWRWWVGPYLRALSALAKYTGFKPDAHKVGAFIAAFGMRVEVQK